MAQKKKKASTLRILLALLPGFLIVPASADLAIGYLLGIGVNFLFAKAKQILVSVLLAIVFSVILISSVPVGGAIGYFAATLVFFLFLRKRPARALKKPIPEAAPVFSISKDEDAGMKLPPALKALREKYEDILNQHEKNAKAISKQLAANRSPRVSDSARIKEIIELCEKDILLAPDVIEYWMQRDHLMGKYEECSYTFDTFQQLATIYEKQQQYDKAIEVCKRATFLGIKDDGTSTGMYRRIERLIELSKDENNLEAN